MSEQPIDWTVEKIPDEANLFRNAHRAHFRGYEDLEPDEIPPGVIKKDNELSADWDRYATPEQTRDRARSPKDNGVVALRVDAIRKQTNQSVEHKPIPKNRAHSEIVGIKDEETRLVLLRIARWAIRAPRP